jgi:hypothetical protein
LPVPADKPALIASKDLTIARVAVACNGAAVTAITLKVVRDSVAAGANKLAVAVKGLMAIRVSAPPPAPAAKTPARDRAVARTTAAVTPTAPVIVRDVALANEADEICVPRMFLADAFPRTA